MTRFKCLHVVFAAITLMTVLFPTVGSAVLVDSGIQQVGAWREGPASAFACRDSIVHVGTGVLLQTWNIADIANPVMTSEIEFSELIQILEIDGDWLIGVTNSSLVTLDLTEPSEPILVATISLTSSYSKRMCLGAGFAYIADLDGEIAIVDLTDPSTPVVAGFQYVWMEVESIAWDNGKLFLGSTFEPLVFVFDVSDPYTVLWPEEHFIEVFPKSDGLFARGGILHVFTRGSGWLMFEVGGVEFTPLGQVSVHAIKAHHFNNGQMVTVENGICMVYDFSVPSDPQPSDQFDPGWSETAQSLRHDGQIFVTKMSDGSININDRAADIQIDVDFPDVVDNGGLYGDTYVTGSFVDHRLSFYDISNPETIDRIGQLDLPWTTNYLTVARGFAVASCLNYGFMVVDLTAGPPFVVRDTIPTAGYTKATGFHEGLLYVSSSDNTLRSYDLSTPGSPVLVAELPTLDYAKDMEFVDDIMIFMSGNSIESYDLSQPSAPVLVGTLDFGNGHFQQVTIANGIVYACGLNTGVVVADLAPNGSLTLLGAYDRPPYVYGLRSRGSRLYASAGADGVAVYDVSTPLDPLPIYEQTMNGFGKSVDMWGDVFVVTNGENGFTVFRDDVVTPVSMGSLTATRTSGGATVSWRFHSDGTEGAFHVWRGDSETDRMQRTEVAITGADHSSWIDSAPPAGATRYWLEDISSAGTTTWYGPIDLAERAQGFHAVLHEPWPNPFNPEVALKVELPAPSHLVVTIHDLRGRRVATLVDGHREAGEIVLSWRGRDDRGRSVQTGTYFVRMSAGDVDQVRKLMLIR